MIQLCPRGERPGARVSGSPAFATGRVEPEEELERLVLTLRARDFGVPVFPLSPQPPREGLRQQGGLLGDPVLRLRKTEHVIEEHCT